VHFILVQFLGLNVLFFHVEGAYKFDVQDFTNQTISIRFGLRANLGRNGAQYLLLGLSAFGKGWSEADHQDDK
jgi:hypothetical protein